jgi:hypothetical protein
LLTGVRAITPIASWDEELVAAEASRYGHYKGTSAGGAMLSLAIFSGNRIDGSMLHPGERFFGLALFGDLDLDLTSAPPELEVTVVAIFGGAKVRVRPDEEVMFDGFSLFGSRTIEPRRLQSPPNSSESSARASDDEAAPLPLDILAYSLFGGVSVKRGQSWIRRLKQSFS